MSSKKKTPIHLEDLTPDEKVKYEIAEELGLLDRVMQDGWKSLTSKETGRIGGLITKKKRENEKNDKSITNVNWCEDCVIKVEKGISICYNRKTGKRVSR
mgnify:FL=1